MCDYTDTFHSGRNKRTAHAAEVMVSLLFEIIPDIQSAIDVGCGVGTWLNVLKKRGIREIWGVDGSWVNKDHLLIPKDSSIVFDLNRPLVINDTFDHHCFFGGNSLPGRMVSCHGIMSMNNGPNIGQSYFFKEDMNVWI